MPSPFLLGGILWEHLGLCWEWFPAEVEEIIRRLVDRPFEMQHLKESVQTIFSEAQFELHKWHSNIPALETDTLQEERSSEQESSYAKQQLGVKPGKTKLLRMPWDKEKDTIAVIFPTQPLEPIKRELLLRYWQAKCCIGKYATAVLPGTRRYLA